LVEAWTLERDEVDSVEREGETTSDAIASRHWNARSGRCVMPVTSRSWRAHIGDSERLAQAGIEQSVGSRRGSYDNTLTETINGLYKAELIHRRAPWKNRGSVELAALGQVARFNRHRPWNRSAISRLRKLGPTLLSATQKYLCYADIDLNLSASTITGGGLIEILYFSLCMQMSLLARSWKNGTNSWNATRNVYRDASMRMLQQVDHYLYYRSVAWLYLSACNRSSSRELLRKTYRTKLFFYRFLPIIITIIGVALREPRPLFTENPNPFVCRASSLIAVERHTLGCIELRPKTCLRV
jgi:hypothetical protein